MVEIQSLRFRAPSQLGPKQLSIRFDALFQSLVGGLRPRRLITEITYASHIHLTPTNDSSSTGYTEPGIIAVIYTQTPPHPPTIRMTEKLEGLTERPDKRDRARRMVCANAILTYDNRNKHAGVSRVEGTYGVALRAVMNLYWQGNHNSRKPVMLSERDRR